MIDHTAAAILYEVEVITDYEIHLIRHVYPRELLETCMIDLVQHRLLLLGHIVEI